MAQWANTIHQNGRENSHPILLNLIQKHGPMSVPENPYQTPEESVSHLPIPNRENPRFVPAMVAALMIACASTGLLSIIFPSIGTFTNPRFGWIGLILCLNPLIFLFPAMKTPTRSAMFVSAFMTFTIAVLNAIQLLATGTVAVVENSFTDRLHSAWLWSVLPFVLAGTILCSQALRMIKNPATA